MKKFLKQLFHSPLGVSLRNISGFRPPIYLHPYQDQFLSSDLFIWRTDKDIETLFKATDILGKFYNLDSKLFFIFFDNYGKLIKSKELHFKNGIAELLIDKEFIGMKGHGTFCALNLPLSAAKRPINVTNRCYVGYGKEKAFSMVHGNLDAVMITNPYTPIDAIIDELRPAVSHRKTSFTYHIQKKASPNSKTSYWFVNPLKRIINVSVNNKSISLESYGCGYIQIEDPSEDRPHVVQSDFAFARPIVICEKDSIIDCHHG